MGTLRDEVAAAIDHERGVSTDSLDYADAALAVFARRLREALATVPFVHRETLDRLLAEAQSDAGEGT